MDKGGNSVLPFNAKRLILLAIVDDADDIVGGGNGRALTVNVRLARAGRESSRKNHKSEHHHREGFSGGGYEEFDLTAIFYTLRDHCITST
jgi:hypothetical protein